jgi:hypothetical protein
VEINGKPNALLPKYLWQIWVKFFVYLTTSLNKVLSSFFCVKSWIFDIRMSSRAVTPGTAALWQLAASLAGLHEPERLSLSPPWPSVTYLALSLSENSRMTHGIGHNAGSYHRAELV